MLPAEQRSQAQAIDPEAYDRAVTRAGYGTDVYQRLHGEGRRGFEEGTFGEFNKEADRLREEAGKSEFETGKKASEEIIKAGSDLGGFVAGEIQKFAEALKTSLTTRLKESRNAS
jgi:hypothetical protein